MDSSVASLASLSSNKSSSRRQRPQPFRFFDLPSELRLRIYDLVLVRPGETVDLDPMNYRNIAPRLSCFFVCRQMHHEAQHVFYGTTHQPFRLYPTHGRFTHTKKPLLTRIGPNNRAAINTIEFRVGPSWSAPPRCWHTGPTLGLADCVSLRTLKLFVQCDPSDPTFNGFRGKGNEKDTYQKFCVTLLQGIVDQVPSLETVEIDAWPVIYKTSPIVQALVAEILRSKKRLVWGPKRGWDQERDSGGLIGLENAMVRLHL